MSYFEATAAILAVLTLDVLILRAAALALAKHARGEYR